MFLPMKKGSDGEWGEKDEKKTKNVVRCSRLLYEPVSNYADFCRKRAKLKLFPFYCKTFCFPRKKKYSNM